MSEKEVCYPCDETCKECEGKSYICTKCKDGMNLVDEPVYGTCPCKEHFFKDRSGCV